jgi:hypothetical protein
VFLMVKRVFFWMRGGGGSSLIPEKLGVVYIFTEIEASRDRHQMEIYARSADRQFITIAVNQVEIAFVIVKWVFFGCARVGGAV